MECCLFAEACCKQRLHGPLTAQRTWLLPHASPDLRSRKGIFFTLSQEESPPQSAGLQEETSSLQPLKNRLNESAVPHQHNLVYINVVLVITIMYVIKRQDNMLPTRLLRGHNLVITIADTRVLKTCQEEKPQMTRKEALSRTTDIAAANFRQEMKKHADCLIPELRGQEAKYWATPMLQQQGIKATTPGGWWLTLACSSEQSAGKLKRIDDNKRSMSDCTARYKDEVQLHTAIQPAVYCKLALVMARNTGHFETVKVHQTDVFDHGSEDLPDA